MDIAFAHAAFTGTGITIGTPIATTTTMVCTVDGTSIEGQSFGSCRCIRHTATVGGTTVGMTDWTALVCAPQPNLAGGHGCASDLQLGGVPLFACFAHWQRCI